MKKHARKLSIILTLVMILTSISFTGAFAGENDVADDAVATEAVEAAEPAADDQAAPADQAVTDDAAAVEDVEAAEPATDDQEATDPEAGDQADQTAEDDQMAPEGLAAGDQAVDEQAADEQAADEETFTITWTNDDGTVLETDEGVAKGSTPSYDGETPVCPKGDETVYKFAGWTPELAEVTADATYTATYKSLAGKPAMPVLKKNKDGKAYASYKSVWIEWNPVTEDENGYPYDESVVVRYVVKPKNKSLKKYDGIKTTYHSNKTTKAALKKVALKPFSTYSFTVSAYITKEDGTKVFSDEQTIKGSPVKSIRYRLTIKEGSTLKRHAGYGPKSYSLKGGVTIDTDRFQTGKYIFEYKGSIFYISQTRVRSAKALYNKRGSWNYLKVEAEHYIKDRKAGSRTKNLVFVNTYCQHAYFFEKKNGKWDCTDGWECGTGLASTPTPTGNYGEKYIHDRIRIKNRIPYWNLFNGNAALHATKPNDHRVGMVISNGCVRNPDAKAKKIYTKTKLKTRVLIV